MIWDGTTGDKFFDPTGHLMVRCWLVPRGIPDYPKCYTDLVVGSLPNNQGAAIVADKVLTFSWEIDGVHDRIRWNP